MGLSILQIISRILIASLILGVLFLGWRLAFSNTARTEVDYRIATAVRGKLTKTIRKQGTIKPVKEQRIVPKLTGKIVEIAPQGSLVNKDSVVLRFDETPFVARKIEKLSGIASLEAEFKKQRAESEKSINQARGDVASQDLRLQLEQMRLDDLKKGPGATEAINASVNLENAQLILSASQDELKALEPLGPLGFISKDDLRQKQFNVDDQVLKLLDAQIAQKKLFLPDKVKLAEQELKVHDAEKNKTAAQERLALLIRNFERDKANQTRLLDVEQIRLKKILSDIEKTVYLAPIHGVVLYKNTGWNPYQVGVDAYDGREVLSIPDYSKIKVLLSIDEAHIGQVVMDQKAQVIPVGWSGAPFIAKVIRVADKGRDEFELFTQDTLQITDKSNRQAFEVEVEIEEPSTSFKLGLRASVEIILNSAEGILLPRTAIYKDAEGLFSVNVELKNGNPPETRPVKIIVQNEYQAIVEGIQEGERVFVLTEDKDVSKK